MRHISGRWFLYSPIVIFLIYLGITSFIEYYNAQIPEYQIVIQKRIINTIVMFTFVWSLYASITCSDGFGGINWKRIYYSPLVIPYIIVKTLMYIDSFFHKHLSIKYETKD